MNQFIHGLQYLFDGFELISKPGLRRFVLIPLLVNIILFFLLFLTLRHYVGEFNYWFENQLPAWLTWLGILIWFVFFLGFFLIFIYTFATLANVIAAPFNSLLSEKVAMFLTKKAIEERSLIENVKDVPRTIYRQLAIIGYFLPRAILLLVLFFIPLIHVFAGLCWFLFSAWLMTLTYVDYPTDNQRIALYNVRMWMRKNRALSFGFGIAVLIATMIPIVNFFVMPAAVAAATKLWIENGD